MVMLSPEIVVAAGLMVVLIVNAVVLAKKISFPYGDASSFLIASESFINPILLKNNYLSFWFPRQPDDPVQKFDKVHVCVNYSIFLNIIRLIPSRIRFRGIQSINIVFYCLFLYILYVFQQDVAGIYGLDQQETAFSSFLFVCIIGFHRRIVLLTALALSDMINYVLFSLALLFVLKISVDPLSYEYIYLLAIVNGLAVRNRFQDIVYVLVFMGALFFVVSVEVVILYCTLVLLMNFDLIITEAYYERCLFRKLKDLVTVWLLASDKDNAKPDSDQWGIFRVFGQGIWKIINPLESDSLWPTLGFFVVLTPLAGGFLLVKAQMLPVEGVLLAYISLMAFIGLWVRHTAFGGGHAKKKNYYFASRQFFLLFPCSVLICSAAYSVLSVNSDYWRSFLILFLVIYTSPQLYKVFQYYLTGEIKEKHFAEFALNPPKWKIELEEFIKKWEGKIVIVGSYLQFGNTISFFEWNREKRFIDVYYDLSWCELGEIIKEFGVTHIAITPNSCFSEPIGKSCVESNDGVRYNMNSLDTVSPDLKLYEICR